MTMIRIRHIQKVQVILVFLLICGFIGETATFTVIKDISLIAFISFGEDGAAWLKIGNKEVLVSPGYAIGSGYRVIAIRHEGVLLYREDTNEYFMIPPEVPDKALNHSQTVIWCSPIPIWKAVRMIALAYKKDYICHAETRAICSPRRHVRNMRDALEACATPHHRFYGTKGLILLAPVHIYNVPWTVYANEVKNFKAIRLTKWFPILEKKGCLISDGKLLSEVLTKIETETGVPIRWQGQLPPLKIYCSFRNRPWYEIISNILLFHGLTIIPYHTELIITSRW